MMNHISIPQYLLESSFCLVIFYLFYHLFLKKETHFQFNRAYLLCTAMFSIIIPVINIDFSKASHISGAESMLPILSQVDKFQIGIHQTIAQESNMLQVSLADLITWTYMAGFFIMTLKLMSGLFKLFGIINRSPKMKDADHTLLISEDVPAASFFSYIFWQDKKDKNDPVQQTILDHEMVHVRQWHSLDVIIMELMVIVKWFNPLIHLFRNSLRQTHEFIADKYVTEKIGSKLEYATILINNRAATDLPPATNHFYGHIKERIQMLSAKKSNTTSQFKYLLAIPLTISLFSLFSFDLSERLPTPIKSSLQTIENTMLATAEANIISLDLDDRVQNEKFHLTWGEQMSLVLTQKFETQDLIFSYSKNQLNQLFQSQPTISQNGKELHLQIDTLEIIKENKKMAIEMKDLKNEEQRQMLIDSLNANDQIKISFKSYSKTDSLRVNLHLSINVHDNSTDHWSYKRDLISESLRWGSTNIKFNDMVTHHGRRLNLDNVVTAEDLEKMLDHKIKLQKDDGPFEYLTDDYQIEINFYRTINNKLSSVSAEEIAKNRKANHATKDMVYMTSYYHGKHYRVVEDTWAQPISEFYDKKDEFKNWLLSAQNGDAIYVTLTPDQGAGKSYQFSLRYRDYSEAISAPFPISLPHSNKSYENFQVVMNDEGKSYVRLDASDDQNRSILNAYESSSSYEIIDIKNFKTKTRVWESNLPEGELIIGDISNLQVRKLDIFRLNEHYSDKDDLVRLDWGKMVSMPNIGNYSLKEFYRSSKDNLQLFTGTNNMDMVRFDLLIIPENGKIKRIRTDNTNTQMIRNILSEVEMNTSIYVDNIIINEDQEYMYYPYNFVFTME